MKQIDGLVVSATTSHDAIDALRESTETLAGLTSGEILSKKYGTQAQFEWWFGVGAYLLGFASLAAGARMIWETVNHLAQDSEISWQFVALKFGISAAIVGAATMAFRLGFRVMQNSNANKRIELELNAIGPFLADLSTPTDIDRAKLQFVEKTFGRTWDGHAADPDGQTQPVDLVKAITDMLVTIAKK